MTADPEKLAALQEFHAARADAINTYAGLEQSLAMLFATLLQADIHKSYIVFHQFINHRSRRKILSELMRLNFGDKYRIFFRSVIQLLENVDRTRNKVIHWIALVTATGGKPFNANKDIALFKHPDAFARGKLCRQQLLEFQKKSEFLRLLIFYFAIFLEHGDSIAPGGKTNWGKIFSERAVYPPPQDHPLYGPDTVP